MGNQHFGCRVLSLFHAHATVACYRAAPICRSIVPHPRPSRVAWQQVNAKACESSSPCQWGMKASLSQWGVKYRCCTNTSARGDGQGPKTTANKTAPNNRDFLNSILCRVFIWGNQFFYNSGTLLRYVPIRVGVGL